MLVSVTDAPGMAAPDASVVNPRSDPLPATWAERLAAHTAARMAPNANRKKVNLMAASPSRNQVGPTLPVRLNSLIGVGHWPLDWICPKSFAAPSLGGSAP